MHFRANWQSGVFWATRNKGLKAEWEAAWHHCMALRRLSDSLYAESRGKDKTGRGDQEQLPEDCTSGAQTDVASKYWRGDRRRVGVKLLWTRARTSQAETHQVLGGGRVQTASRPHNWHLHRKLSRRFLGCRSVSYQAQYLSSGGRGGHRAVEVKGQSDRLTQCSFHCTKALPLHVLLPQRVLAGATCTLPRWEIRAGSNGALLQKLLK